MILRRVLLPQPDGPTMLAKLPRAICRLNVSMTVNSPSPPGVGIFLLTPSMTTAYDAIAPSSCERGPPGKNSLFPPLQYQHVDRNHQQHKARAPRQHHVDAHALQPVHQLFADTARGTESFTHPRDLPCQREADTQRCEEIWHERRN